MYSPEPAAQALIHFCLICEEAGQVRNNIMIEIKNLSKAYQMGTVKVEALRGVSLKISSGEFVAIIGASGSGKSTLMHVLGLLDRPDSGEYFLGGEDVTKLTDYELALVRNRLVGFVFQQFHLLPRMTALENAELPLIYAGKRDTKQVAIDRLTEVGLKDRILHRPNEMSGGQQQRVAIARSLVKNVFSDPINSGNPVFSREASGFFILRRRALIEEIGNTLSS